MWLRAPLFSLDGISYSESDRDPMRQGFLFLEEVFPARPPVPTGSEFPLLCPYPYSSAIPLIFFFSPSPVNLI